MASNEAKVIISVDDKTKTGITSVNKAVAQLGTTIAAAFSIKKIVDFAVASVKAYNDTQTAIMKLTTLTKQSVGATDLQIKALVEQASALQKVGVVSDDAVLSLQGQLATFDLQTESIGKLVPALLDVVVAEKGVNASTDEMISYANAFGLALQGNYKALTQRGFKIDEETQLLIKNGSEQEKITAIVKFLTSTYGDLNKKMRETPAGQIKALKMEFEDLKKTVGQVLSKAIQPLVAGLLKMISDFNNLPTTTKQVIIVLGTLITVFGSLLILIGLIQPALLVAASGLAIFKAAMIAVTGPVGWVYAAIAGVITVVGLLGVKLGWFSDEGKESGDTAESLAKNLEKLELSTMGSADAMEELAKKTKDARKEVLDLQKQMAKEIMDSGERQMELNQEIGDTIVEQEEKISDIKQQISDELHQDSESRDREKIDELREQLAIEQEALASHKDLLKTYANEVTEARRVASLTEFQRKIEQLQKEKEAEQKRLIERIAELQVELLIKQAYLDEVLKAEKKHYADLKVERDQNVLREQEAAEKIQNARLNASYQKLKNSGQELRQRATGGPVSSGTPYIVGERGPELFTPNSSGMIIPNNRLAGAGSGITINITGNTLLDGSAGDKLAAQIMRTLKQNLRI